MYASCGEHVRAPALPGGGTLNVDRLFDQMHAGHGHPASEVSGDVAHAARGGFHEPSQQCHSELMFGAELPVIFFCQLRHINFPNVQHRPQR